MRNLTTYELEAELLPARELMGGNRGRSSFTYTSIYNQGSFDGNGNLGLVNIGNGSFDGNDTFVVFGGGGGPL